MRVCSSEVVAPPTNRGTRSPARSIASATLHISSRDGVIRPDIVFFGEAVPNIEKAINLVEKADILLIVGTSLQVYPAAGLYRYAPASAPIYIIDPADVSVYDKRITHIRAVATAGMREFINLL